ncbi:PASTA domain-containing protein [Egicoccus halophilus]|uniref:PASTA domain-containing protein n=1 Tax=Egicoccus halophilus TaxID=1670830 RepID=A0A8J3ABT8_9ACTN|nr:PASTA domain-containing protein [Egicoccus halophilus]GGI04445.1 hypothetical protein GCM10011354_09130 [Egicoccus halophilus]
MKFTTRAGLATLLAAVAFATGCAGGGDTSAAGDADAVVGEEAGAEPEAEAESSTMPDVVGMPADEAVAQLEESGFVVTTGIVRTAEMDPDLVYRSEPAAGRQIQDGQRVTLRIAGEPRD